MGEQYQAVAEQVRDHLQSLVKTAGLEEGDESLEILAEGWLEKQSAFHEQTKANEMEETDVLELEDGRGALVMTYSGSLLTIGPETDEGRTVEYASIGLRHDVPEFVRKEGSVLAGDVTKDAPVEFETGPIQKSSAVYAIAVAKEDLNSEDEEELLGQVTMMVAADFAEVNKTIVAEEA